MRAPATQHRRPRSQSHLPLCAMLLAAAGAAAPANAQWVVVNLHPDGAQWSEARAIHDGQTVGQISDNGWRAVMWTGSADSMVDLTPAAATFGGIGQDALAAFGGQQGGFIRSAADDRSHAALWSGTAQSFTDLHPPEIDVLDSRIVAMDDGIQAGFWSVSCGDTFCSATRACIWRGTPESFVDLHPIHRGATDVRDVGGSQVVGGHYDNGLANAVMWTNATPGSYVEIHPADAFFSIAECTDGVHQYGYILHMERGSLVGRWSSTADSFVDMTPPGLFGASIADAIPGTQVGATASDIVGNNPWRAALWHDTAESYVDLHAFLPPEYFDSEARGIWQDADGTTYVVGRAWNANFNNRREAVMWVSCPAELTADGVVDVFDLLAYLDLWFASDAAAERTGDDPAVIDVFDLLGYLDTWFAGC